MRIQESSLSAYSVYSVQIHYLFFAGPPSQRLAYREAWLNNNNGKFAITYSHG